MKLILAIVNNDDAQQVNYDLSSSGFFVTKISSTGGFLKSGNSTFLMGVDDGDIEKVIEIIKRNSKKREQNMPLDMANRASACAAPTLTVTVGGATVFVLNVEDCRHI